MASGVGLSGLRIGVVGLGTAGCASAVLLARQGHDVTCFEKTPREYFSDVDGMAGTGGAGIGMQPIGLTALKHIGDDVLNTVLEKGARIDRLHSTTRCGRTVLDLSYADFRKELYGLGLHRDVLFRVLFEKAQDEGVNIIADFPIEDIRAQDDGKYINGEGPYDLIVVADGRDSIRKHMSIASTEYAYHFGCLWSLIPDITGEFSAHATLHQRLDTAKIMLGLLPTGHTMDAKDDDPSLISLFWSLEMSTLPTVHERGLDAWKELVVDLEPRTESLLEQVTSMDQLIPAAYSDTFMPKYYSEDLSAVFLGDCAHATSPQLGQGANLALVDALALSEAVRGSSNVASALRAYDSARRWRLRFYQLNSHLLTPVFQSNSRIYLIRDALMGPLCHFPPTRHQMLTTLVGAQKNGIPWALIPEEEYMFV